MDSMLVVLVRCFPEEFVSIGGWNVDVIPVILPSHLGYRDLFGDFLGISKDVTNLMVQGDKIGLLQLIVKFINLE